MSKAIVPSFVPLLARNLKESPQFVQVVLGPRQVGKTTGVHQLLAKTAGPRLYASADDEISPTAAWIEEKWQEALATAVDSLLVIDEIQKIPDWSQAVKRLWDRQARERKTKMRLVLLGSSSLHLQNGLSESLTGRFQLLKATHWDLRRSQSLTEMTMDQFIRFGGYPGSYALLNRPGTWEKYIRDSIIDTVVGKDILQATTVQKPALFRQAFEILMSYPAQEISYTKLLGQLQDKGNTDLVKRYIELYEGAYLIKALQKYSGKALLSRASSPKLVPLCGALIDRALFETKEGFGRAFEAAVGASLINHELPVSYWREGNAEVDYVVPHHGNVFAIEVKSGRVRSVKGMELFIQRFPKAKPVYITPLNMNRLLEDPVAFLERLASPSSR